MHSWKSRCLICKTIFALIIIGALNWGLVGLGDLLGRDLNLVELILGSGSTVAAIIYLVIGIAALAKLFFHCKCGDSCGSDCKCGDDCKCDNNCDCGHDHDGHEHHDHDHGSHAH